MTDRNPRPAAGHMPFEGHRTVAEVWEQQERAARRPDRFRRAKQFGFDPASLRPRREGAP